MKCNNFNTLLPLIILNNTNFTLFFRPLSNENILLRGTNLKIAPVVLGNILIITFESIGIFTIKKFKILIFFFFFKVMQFIPVKIQK